MTRGVQHPRAEDAYPVLRYLALKAKGLSGADIERLLREARQKARRENRAIAFSDILALLDAVRPELPEPLRWRMAVHEAGHAIARLALGFGEIAAITIDSADGAYVESNRLLADPGTETTVATMLVVKLAGRAAEEELLGSPSAGAGGSADSDLATSTELAFAMETSLGFSKQWPLLYRPVEDRSSLLAYDPALAEQVNIRLEDAYGRACALVRRNKQALRMLADILIDRHTLEGRDLEAVLARVKRRMVDPQTQEGRRPNPDERRVDQEDGDRGSSGEAGPRGPADECHRKRE